MAVAWEAVASHRSNCLICAEVLIFSYVMDIICSNLGDHAKLLVPIVYLISLAVSV